MTTSIDGLEPRIFWRCFAEICRIPRPSGHEGQIAEFVLNRAKKLGLQTKQDACGNVVVKKPASPGREGARGICLQSHLDMVCEKNADKVHDFLHDPIELVRRGEVLTANGTTLGADNGVGVATSLAIMEDTMLEHGPLELLFTIEEETGLTGAKGLAPELVEHRTLLNMDSEEEGVLYVGCAGGKDTLGSWQVTREPAPADAAAISVSVKGLKGGHSGLEIDKGLGNAIKLLNRVVLKLSELGARLSFIEGGRMRNAIPRECTALLTLPKRHLDQAKSMVDTFNITFRSELASIEPDLVLAMTQLDGAQIDTVLELSLQQKLCLAISAMPTGVQQMSADIPGLVETSTNLAAVTTSDREIVLVTSQRSSVASRLSEVVEGVQAVFMLGGASFETSEGYPGWKPNLDSPILTLAKKSYRALYGKEVEVKAIHAGLECGILGERIAGLDMISFGPTLAGVHSPEERIYLDSVGKYWDFLLAILKSAE